MAGRRFCIAASVPAIGVPVEASANLNARLGNTLVINAVPSTDRVGVDGADVCYASFS